MSTQTPWPRSIYLILAVALVLRIAAAWYWDSSLPDGQQFRLGDSDGYWHLAEQVAHGQPYQYGSPFASVFRTPGYPVFLAPLFWFWDDPPVLAARCLGCLAGVLSVGLVWIIGRQLFDDRSALLAAGLAAVYPGGIAISILVLAEALFVPLMLGQFAAWIDAFQTDSKSRFVRSALVAGVLNGLACLTRPSWLLFVPFLLLGGLVFYGDRKRQVQMFLLVVIATCCTMTPWWIRNYQVTGKLVWTSLQTGPSLYDGLHESATGASDMSFAPPMRQEYLERYQREKLGPDREFEYSFNELMKKRAIEWAVAHPLRVAELAWIKFVRTWNPFPNNDELGSSAMRWGMAIFFVPTVLLAVAGAIRYRQDFLVIATALFPAVYFTGLHMIFVGSIRYRHPPMMLLLLLAAVMLSRCFAGRSRDS